MLSKIASKALNSAKFHRQVPQVQRVHFLGTGSAVPQPNKCNVSSCVFTLTNGRSIMIDCGEATQHQAMRSSTLKMRSVDAILITHMHGDHFFGIFGFLATLGTCGKETDVYVVGPKGIKRVLDTVLATTQSENPQYQLHIIEVETFGVNNVSNEYSSGNTESRNMLEPNRATLISELSELLGVDVIAVPIAHRVPTVGYIIQEHPKPGALNALRARELGASGPQLGLLKDGNDVVLPNGTTITAVDVQFPATPGRKFSFLQDTHDASFAAPELYDCDVMIHEATYDESMEEKAVAHGHSTTKMASEFAFRTNAKNLIITHFSARYSKMKIRNTEPDPRTGKDRYIFVSPEQIYQENLIIKAEREASEAIERAEKEKIAAEKLAIRKAAKERRAQKKQELEGNMVEGDVNVNDVGTDVKPEKEIYVEITNNDVKRLKSNESEKPTHKDSCCSSMCDDTETTIDMNEANTQVDISVFKLGQEAQDVANELLQNPASFDGAYYPKWVFHEDLYQKSLLRTNPMECFFASDFKSFEFAKDGKLVENEFAEVTNNNLG